MSAFLVQPHENAPLSCAYGNPLCPDPRAPMGYGFHTACSDVEDLNVPPRLTLADPTNFGPMDVSEITILDETDSHPARTTIALTVEQLQALLDAATIVLGLRSSAVYESHDEQYEDLREARDVLHLAA